MALKERESMIKFGTGGWRAIIGDEFIKSNVVSLAQAIADDMAGEENGIVIGYDRRFLSDMASKWAAEVFAANGITVHVDPVVAEYKKLTGVDLTKYGFGTVIIN